MIKRSTALRLVQELLALALAALFAFAMSVAAERVLNRGVSFLSQAANFAPLMIAYAGGRLCAGRKAAAFRLLRAVSVAAAVCVCALVSGTLSLAKAVPTAGMAISAIVLCRVGAKAVPIYPQAAAAASIAVYLLNLILAHFAVGGSAAVSACAVANFVLCLAAANLKSVADGAHGGEGRVPAGIRRSNMIMLAVFSLGAFAIAATGIVQRVFTAVVTAAYGIISAIIAFFKGLFPDRDVPMDMPTGEGEVLEFADVEVGAWKYLVYAFFLILTILFVIMLVIYIVRLIKSRDGRARRRKSGQRRRFFADNDEDDEIESTLSLDEFLASGRRGLQGLLERMRRKPRFEDMKTDSERVRFAFRELKRGLVDSMDVEPATPLELGRAAENAEIAELTMDYSAMRYGDIAPDARGGDNARRAMNGIKNIRKNRQ